MDNGRPEEETLGNVGEVGDVGVLAGTWGDTVPSSGMDGSDVIRDVCPKNDECESSE